MPRACALELVEVSANRTGNIRSPGGARDEECRRLLAAVPGGDYRIALDEKGKQWSTGEFAATLDEWMAHGRNVSLLVGGADGLSPACIQGADAHWSLSRLTFPHALVRVLVAEQVYRAWTIHQHHPYHRA